jgi:hypothetical protein
MMAPSDGHTKHFAIWVGLLPTSEHCRKFQRRSKNAQGAQLWPAVNCYTSSW